MKAKARAAQIAEDPVRSLSKVCRPLFACIDFVRDPRSAP